MVSIKYSEAIVEVLEILKSSSIQEQNKIPKKLMIFFEENASKTYTISFNPTLSLDKLQLKTETIGLLSMIFLNYLCPLEEKEYYLTLLDRNQEIYEKQLHEKYKTDNLFNNSSSIIKNLNNTLSNINSNRNLTIYKENIFQKIINKIKSFLK